MTPAEKIARDTWVRIKHSHDVQVRLGEETFTDLLILDFIRLMGNRTKLFQSTRDQESIRGTDLEIRIQKGGNRAMAFAVQAKKLDRSGRYGSLNYRKKDNPLQIDILETYSRSMRAIPLYLLYNYVNRQDIEPYWHCCEPLDERQLGCTLVPSRIIRQAIETHGCRKFDWIHKPSAALPWRCFFDCPRISNATFLPPGKENLLYKLVFLTDGTGKDIEPIPSENGSDYNYGWVNFEPVDGGWPEWLWSRNDATLSSDDVDKLRHEIFRQESRLFGTVVAPAAGFSPGPPGNLLLVKEEDEVID